MANTGFLHSALFGRFSFSLRRPELGPLFGGGGEDTRPTEKGWLQRRLIENDSATPDSCVRDLAV